MTETERLHETHVCRDCGAEITIPYARVDSNLEGYWERAYWKVVPTLATLTRDVNCLHCGDVIVYRPDDPVIHVGCDIAVSSDEAFEWDRLRRIEAAAQEAVDAAGSGRWPVNCDRLRMALAGLPA